MQGEAEYRRELQDEPDVPRGGRLGSAARGRQLAVRAAAVPLQLAGSRDAAAAPAAAAATAAAAAAAAALRADPRVVLRLPRRVGGDRPLTVAALLAHKCDIEGIASGTSHFVHIHNTRPFQYVDSTPLQLAVQFGRMETMRALLSGGADINAQSGDGGTALHVAAAHLQLGAAEVLIDAGADGRIESGIDAVEVKTLRKSKPKKKAEKASGSTDEEGGADEETKENSGKKRKKTKPKNDKKDKNEKPEDEEEEEKNTPKKQPMSGPAQYGSGLTAAQVAAATRDAAVLQQDKVEYSLDGFTACGKMKDEVDLAQEMFVLLSNMKVPEPPEEISVESSASDNDEENGGIGRVVDDSDAERGSDDGKGPPSPKEEEVTPASPAR